MLRLSSLQQSRQLLNELVSGQQIEMPSIQLFSNLRWIQQRSQLSRCQQLSLTLFPLSSYYWHLMTITPTLSLQLYLIPASQSALISGLPSHHPSITPHHDKIYNCKIQHSLTSSTVQTNKSRPIMHRCGWWMIKMATFINEHMQRPKRKGRTSTNHLMHATWHWQRVLRSWHVLTGRQRCKLHSNLSGSAAKHRRRTLPTTTRKPWSRRSGNVPWTNDMLLRRRRQRRRQRYSWCHDVMRWLGLEILQWRRWKSQRRRSYQKRQRLWELQNLCAYGRGVSIISNQRREKHQREKGVVKIVQSLTNDHLPTLILWTRSTSISQCYHPTVQMYRPNVQAGPTPTPHSI